MTEPMDEQEAAYQKACAEVEAKRQVVRNFLLRYWGLRLLPADDVKAIELAFPMPEPPKRLRVVELDNGSRYRCRDGVLEWQVKSICWRPAMAGIDHYVAIASLKDRPYED